MTQCLTHTAENVKAADQLCRETKSNQQVPINRTICYLDYKQSDPCNPEVCNGTFQKFQKIEKCNKMCSLYILDCNYRKNYFFQISFPLINIFSCNTNFFLNFFQLHLLTVVVFFFMHYFFIRCTSSTHWNLLQWRISISWWKRCRIRRCPRWHDGLHCFWTIRH